MIWIQANLNITPAIMSRFDLFFVVLDTVCQQQNTLTLVCLSVCLSSTNRDRPMLIVRVILYCSVTNMPIIILLHILVCIQTILYSLVLAAQND
jgi:hypothetical protein